MNTEKTHGDRPNLNLRWSVLAAGFLLVLASSLSVHVVILQILNIPYPGNLPAGGWARLPDRLLSVFAAIIVYVMLSPTTRRKPLWQQAGLLFLLIGMIHESLIRLPAMNIFVASRWTFWPFLDAVPTYIVVAALATSIIAMRNLLGSPIYRLSVALVISIAVYMLFAPALNWAFAGVTAWTALREGHTLYNPPYDWHVEVPAYITFIEPVLAAFVVSAFVSQRLPYSRLRAWAALTLLLFALRGQFFSIFVNIAYANTDALTAMLSFGQFALESFLLAAITAATWVLATPRPAGGENELPIH